MKAAVGRAFVAGGGAIVFVGGATVLASSAATMVVRGVITQQKKKLMIPCPPCSGTSKVVCDVCRGDRVLLFLPGKGPPLPGRTQRCVCAMCDGTGRQACLNCLGEGMCNPEEALALSSASAEPGTTAS